MTLLRESVSDFRVTVVNGARQSGKTVLLGQLHAAIGGTSVTFDDPEILNAARADPVGFVHGFSKPLLIDEVERAGDPLLRAIKAHVDRDPTPGRFVLAGSTRFLTVPTLSESLAGRARIVDLWPFSQGELSGTTECFLDRIFETPDATSKRNRHRSIGRRCFAEFASAASPRSSRNDPHVLAARGSTHTSER